eukprot:Skav208439  [mRNA]  locus=scaffold1952:149847:155209:- [translate_table: standard]
MAAVWRLPVRGGAEEKPLTFDPGENDRYVRGGGTHQLPHAKTSFGASTRSAVRQVVGLQDGQRWPRGSVALGSMGLVAGVARSAKRRRSDMVRKAAKVDVELPKPVPVILLSGFLGTGKTTLLRHWLENSTDRVGVVVNDVAAVNIDSKLVQQQTYNPEGEVNAIQLEHLGAEVRNGCACCSLGDELLVSIYDLLELATQER